MNYQRNHEPDQQGIWFAYTGFRFKNVYDIKLKGGQIIENCQPNGAGWYGKKRYDDKNVIEIRLKPDCELDD